MVLRGDTWKLLEYCQGSTLLGNMEEEIPNPASVILLLSISRDDWLSPQELGLVIESPQNIGGLSQPQLDPQVPQVFRIEVHCLDRAQECDDPDGQQAQHPCMDSALSGKRVSAHASNDEVEEAWKTICAPSGRVCGVVGERSRRAS